MIGTRRIYDEWTAESDPAHQKYIGLILRLSCGAAIPPKQRKWPKCSQSGADLRKSEQMGVSRTYNCTSNAPPWFTWCSIQIVRPQGTDTMGLHSHLRDGAPMALIVCVGSFTGGEFWVESGGLLNPSMREKKRKPVCARVGRWRVGHAPPPPKPRCCSTPGHYTLHCHGRAGDGAGFFIVRGGVLHCKPVWRQQLVSMGFRVPNALGGSSCMVKITPNAPNLDHAKK